MISINSFALYGILLAIVLLIAFLSWFLSGGKHKLYQRKAKRLYKKLQTFPDEYPGKMIAYLKKINPYVFEELLLVAFQHKGYRVYRNKRYSGDGGIDGRIKKDGQVYYIQAKRYESHINSKHVLNFCAVCVEHDVKGFFVHTGKTGEKSRRLAYNEDRVTIISGKKLVELIKNK